MPANSTIDNDLQHTPSADDSEVHDFSAPLGQATSGRLIFESGASTILLRADRALRDLFRARFDHPAPRVDTRDGTVSIRYRDFSLLNWLLYWRAGGTITLNGSIPWEIAIHGGVSRLTADLREIALTGLDVTGGVSHGVLKLPRPSGTVPVHLAHGVSDLTIRRPAGVPVRVHAGGGVSSLILDRRQMGAVASDMQAESPDYRDATDRYDITIGGGVSHATVDTW